MSGWLIRLAYLYVDIGDKVARAEVELREQQHAFGRRRAFAGGQPDQLRDAGIQVPAARPPMNMRTGH